MSGGRFAAALLTAVVAGALAACTGPAEEPVREPAAIAATSTAPTVPSAPPEPSASQEPSAPATPVDLALVPHFAGWGGEKVDPFLVIQLWEYWKAAVTTQQCMTEAGHEWALEVRDQGSGTEMAVVELGRPSGDGSGFLRAPLTSPQHNDARLRELGPVAADRAYRAYYGDELVNQFADFGMGFEADRRPTTHHWNADAYPGGCYAVGMDAHDASFESQALARELEKETMGLRHADVMSDARAAFTECVHEEGIARPVDVTDDGDLAWLEESDAGYEALDLCLGEFSEAEREQAQLALERLVAREAAALQRSADEARELRAVIDADEEFAAFIEELSDQLVAAG